MTSLIVFVLFCALTLNSPSRAYALEWSEIDQADIRSAENFLNELDTYQAQFIQVSSSFKKFSAERISAWSICDHSSA